MTITQFRIIYVFQLKGNETSRNTYIIQYIFKVRLNDKLTTNIYVPYVCDFSLRSSHYLLEHSSLPVQKQQFAQLITH